MALKVYTLYGIELEMRFVFPLLSFSVSHLSIQRLQLRHAAVLMMSLPSNHGPT